MKIIFLNLNWDHFTQHNSIHFNDTQPIDTQYKVLICNTALMALSITTIGNIAQYHYADCRVSLLLASCFICCYGECQYTECQYAQCSNAECQYDQCSFAGSYYDVVILEVILINVIMLNVILLNVIMLSANLLSRVSFKFGQIFYCYTISNFY